MYHRPPTSKDGKKHSSEKKSKYKTGSSVKFRCEATATQLRAMQARGWARVYSDRDWDLWWCDSADIRFAFEGLGLKPNQRVSHFRKHGELTRKDYLYRNLKRYKRLLIKAGKKQESEFCDSMPTTFELPSELLMFVEEHSRNPGSTWIIKPVSGSQGRGIFLFQKLSELKKLMRKIKTKTGSAMIENYIIQRYIDNPYLLEGCKFDMRIYVLVTSFAPLKVWLAREGFARLSGEEFSLKKIHDNRIHLTNMSIQLKKHEDRSEVKLGRKLALEKLKEYLVSIHGESSVEDVMLNIAGIIMASLQAVQPVVIASRNSFELYGYDILLDEKLKPWLLEVNASPSLTATDKLDYRLKFDLIDDVLNILDFERIMTGQEIRIGGFDLLWNDGPVWAEQGTKFSMDAVRTMEDIPKLNIFLGCKNDRVDQLITLKESLRKLL